MIPPEILLSAKTYVIDLLLENEEVKKFPKDFITEGMKWVRSWFLKDDPATQTTVESAQPTATKEAVIEAKLDSLLKNELFVAELQQQLAAYQTHVPNRKNVVDGSQITATGHVHIGDKTATAAPSEGEKNVIKGGSVVQSGGDFRLGDG